MRWRRRRRFILPRALAQRLGDHLTLPPKTTLKEGPLSFSTLVNDSCTNRAGNSEHPALAGCFSSNRPLRGREKMSAIRFRQGGKFLRGLRKARSELLWGVLAYNIAARLVWRRGPDAGWRRKRRRSGGWGGEKGRETARNDRFRAAQAVNQESRRRSCGFGRGGVWER